MFWATLSTILNQPFAIDRRFAVGFLIVDYSVASCFLVSLLPPPVHSHRLIRGQYLILSPLSVLP